MVYIIRSEDGFAKIGLARHPWGRLAELQTGNPHRLALDHYFDFAEVGCDPRKVERAVHRELAHLHKRGEWFLATDEEIFAAMCVVDRDTPRDHARKGGEVMPAATSRREGGQGARSPVAASVDPATKERQAEGDSPKPAGPFDKVAYQREYMRKRRAQQKGKA